MNRKMENAIQEELTDKIYKFICFFRNFYEDFNNSVENKQKKIKTTLGY